MFTLLRLILTPQIQEKSTCKPAATHFFSQLSGWQLIVEIIDFSNFPKLKTTSKLSKFAKIVKSLVF